jgi:hypothetical protein
MGSWANVVSTVTFAGFTVLYAHLNVTLVAPALAEAYNSNQLRSFLDWSLLAWEAGWLLTLVMGWLLSRYVPFVSIKARYELARRVLECYDVSGDEVRLAVASPSLMLPRRKPKGFVATEIKRRLVLAYRYDTRIDWLAGETPRLIILVLRKDRDVFVVERRNGVYVEARHRVAQRPAELPGLEKLPAPGNATVDPGDKDRRTADLRGGTN